MKKNVFTLLITGLILLMSSPSFAQSYGFYTEKPGWMQNGDFLTDPDLIGAAIAADKQATVRMITNGHADSVYFGQNAIYANLTDDADGKDRLEFKVGTDADMSFFNAGELVFWIKLLAPTTDINFEVSANRNEAGEAKGNDISMKDELGLDVLNDTTWQKITIDLSGQIDGDNFNYNIFEAFGFRSRENASEFIVDEMHVVYYGAYGMYTDKVGWMADGDFLTDPNLTGAEIAADKQATVRMITNGHADSVYFGQNAIYVNLTDDADGKDRLELKVGTDADMSLFNAGQLIFWIKLLAPVTDINFELSANRNDAGEAKGNDISMKDELGLDVLNDSTWQKITLDLTQPIDGDDFNFNIFESLGFRSRGNPSEFIVDEMHVILSGGYGMIADKPGYKLDGDFMTDPNLTGATIAADKQATVRMITSGHADSVYFGQNAVYANLTDDADGKDRLEFKVGTDADMSFFNNGTLIFWIKLLATTTDINFEVSANRNEAGEAKGNDISMKDELGLDVLNDSTWQKIMVDLSEPIDGDNFNYNIFEAFGFRSRGNPSEFIIDEMHVHLTSPLERYVEYVPSDIATLETLTVSVGTLTPAFSPDLMAYTLEAPVGTTAVTVDATTTDVNATLAGTGDIDLSSGTAQATVTVTAEDGVTTKAYVIDFTRDATQVEEDQFHGASVYPNPASDQLIVELGDNQVNVVGLVNLLGQTMITKKVDGEKMVFNVADLGEGLYIVSFDGKPFRKIVIN